MPVAHFATVKTIDPPVASLVGDRFVSVSRRAKRILFTTESGPTLVLHLMSAGKLTVGTSSRPRSTMLEVDFDGGLPADDRDRPQAEGRSLAADARGGWPPSWPASAPSRSTRPSTWLP